MIRRRRSLRPRAALLAVWACLLPAWAAGEPPKPLWVIDVSVAGGTSPVALPIRVRLYSAAPAALAAPLPGVVSVASDHVVLDLEPAPVLGRGDAAPPESSFLVDYEAPAVAALTRSLVGRFGPAPDNPQLVSFVRATVGPGSARGFDVASQVASGKSGDCTEHAVLLAALARSVGLPARVVIGTVFVGDGTRIGAYGHAWNEIHRDGVWELVDSTPLVGAEPVAYVPEGLLADEGPGYVFGLASLLATGILRVEILGEDAAEPTRPGR